MGSPRRHRPQWQAPTARLARRTESPLAPSLQKAGAEAVED